MNSPWDRRSADSARAGPTDRAVVRSGGSGWPPALALALALAAVLAGCAHSRPSVRLVEGRQYVVQLPAVRLNDQESIQTFELEIRSGRLSAIRRLLDDWDLEVVWDHPDRLLVRGQARHFPAGLRDTADLSEMFTVQVHEVAGFRVTAVLVTETATPAEIPEAPSRTIRIAAAELVFSQTRGRTRF